MQCTFTLICFQHFSTKLHGLCMNSRRSSWLMCFISYLSLHKFYSFEATETVRGICHWSYNNVKSCAYKGPFMYAIHSWSEIKFWITNKLWPVIEPERTKVQQCVDWNNYNHRMWALVIGFIRIYNWTIFSVSPYLAAVLHSWHCIVVKSVCSTAGLR